ncbi:hydroxymethylbilane synthase [uncultured Helicobacter sp.]|uniref:hydroxymethylbilane synthase n=1 Tax=uncultured Helicobacter sp. TaxID=175537 RepID=UPI001C3A03D9|nr:hydroxymethylbilane synthase [Candidatus Helicobacter avicola]
MPNKLIIGTRGSALALWQAEHIKKRLWLEHGLESELKIIKTKGDKILDVPLAKIGGKGLFTKELEEMLLSGDIDLAVHSLKDVPVELENGLELVAITKRASFEDCFVSEKYASLDDLPQNARVGTTSLRRSMQLKILRRDLDTLSLRGNVQTRLQKLKNGEFDAIILAKAALERLEIDEVAYIKPLAFMIPAMGQGALGIECASENLSVIKYVRQLQDMESAICCSAEREFIRTLEGGCQVPIGVYAHQKSTQLVLEAILGLPDGSASIRSTLVCVLDSNPEIALISAKNLGVQLAQKFIANGAKELLEQAYQMV